MGIGKQKAIDDPARRYRSRPPESVLRAKETERCHLLASGAIQEDTQRGGDGSSNGQPRVGDTKGNPPKSVIMGEACGDPWQGRKATQGSPVKDTLLE